MHYTHKRKLHGSGTPMTKCVTFLSAIHSLFFSPQLFSLTGLLSSRATRHEDTTPKRIKKYALSRTCGIFVFHIIQRTKCAHALAIPANGIKSYICRPSYAGGPTHSTHVATTAAPAPAAHSSPCTFAHTHILANAQAPYTHSPVAAGRHARSVQREPVKVECANKNRFTYMARKRSRGTAFQAGRRRRAVRTRRTQKTLCVCVSVCVVYLGADACSPCVCIRDTYGHKTLARGLAQ